MTICFVQLLLTLSIFFQTSDFNSYELEMGGPVWPTMVSPHWCWTDSYCLFTILEQKCVSMIKNTISSCKWFFRTEEVGREFLKYIFQIQWPSVAFSSHPSDLHRCCGFPFTTWSNRRVSSWLLGCFYSHGHVELPEIKLPVHGNTRWTH